MDKRARAFFIFKILIHFLTLWSDCFFVGEKYVLTFFWRSNLKRFLAIEYVNLRHHTHAFLELHETVTYLGYNKKLFD